MDVTMASTPDEKIRLFRAMFRGREDVYARRYVSAKSGKCGYSPVCAVEWTRGICDKKRVACAVCPNRKLLPLDDDTVRMHLKPGDSPLETLVKGLFAHCCWLARFFSARSTRSTRLKSTPKTLRLCVKK